MIASRCGRFCTRRRLRLGLRMGRAASIGPASSSSSLLTSSISSRWGFEAGGRQMSGEENWVDPVVKVGPALEVELKVKRGVEANCEDGVTAVWCRREEDGGLDLAFGGRNR